MKSLDLRTRTQTRNGNLLFLRVGDRKRIWVQFFLLLPAMTHPSLFAGEEGWVKGVRGGG